MMIRAPLLLSLCIAFAGCGMIDRLRGPDAPLPAPGSTPAAVQIAPPVETTPLGTPAATLDSTTAAQKTAALSAPGATGERALGQVVVSLGTPSEQGLWLRTALVQRPAKGRVMTAGGQSLAVDLLPGEGPAQLSLAAFQALKLPLTDLPALSVFGP